MSHHIKLFSVNQAYLCHRYFVTSLAEETDLVRGPFESFDCPNSDFGLAREPLL